MGPLGFPWLTFMAIAVTAVAVVASILWAVFTKSKEIDNES